MAVAAAAGVVALLTCVIASTLSVHGTASTRAFADSADGINGGGPGAAANITGAATSVMTSRTLMGAIAAPVIGLATAVAFFADWHN